MKGDSNKIEPPKSDMVSDLARATARAAVGMIPITGGALAEVANFLLPDPTTTNRQRWEGDISDAVNDLNGKVERIASDQSITLTGVVANVAKYIAEHCPDGLGHQHITLDELVLASPDYTKSDILRALGDLESYGWIESVCFIGQTAEYKISHSGYVVFDPPIMGWDNYEDAKSIAKLVVKNEGGSQSSDLELELGWSHRRFNPALRIVLRFIGSGRVSNNLQPNYVSEWFSPNNAEMAKLRRFSEER